MKGRLILLYIAAIVILILATPFLMIGGVFEAWEEAIAIFKRWRGLYGRQGERQ